MSTSSASEVSTQPTTRRYAAVAAWVAFGVVCLLSYGHALRLLFVDWVNDPDYSFGLVAPFAIAYIIYSRREKFRAQPILPNALLGIGVIVLSQLMFIAGELSAEFFLQRSSIVVLVAGMILYLAGWGWLKRLLLPLCLFQLTIPLPAILLQEVSLPLQLISSTGAATLLRLCGIPVYRSGNILQLPHQMVSVTEACSGLRSLASMVALALILISSSRLRWWLRALFVGSAVLVAVAANSLRVTGTGLLGEYAGRHTTVGLWHSFQGWFVFITAFLMLIAELALLQRLFAKQTAKVTP